MADLFDVVVVGAGPAGVAAALTAHEHGLRTVCLDKARFPRDKTCGDGLTANALRLLEQLGLDRSTFTSTGAELVTETVIVSPRGRQVRLPLPRNGTHAAVIRRADLDAALVGHARARGVEIREDTPIEKVVERDGVVELNGGIEARHVIACDGHWSPVRRALEPDLPRDLGEWHAARQYFAGVHDPRLWVLFERDLLPGYAWVFPLGEGRANVGFGVLRADGRSGRELKDLWPALLQRPTMRAILGPHAHALEPVHAWPIPTRYEPRRLRHGRVLFAGDAAGVVDPMTGEGIAQALETGMLAADAIATGADYARLVHRVLGRDLRFATFLQKILRHPVGAETAIRVADLNDWTRHNFARWMWEDYPRALLGTPDRWHRGALAYSGAYLQ
jgi:geranylgeranyl reductase family protein